jgi:hypothetical protein
LGAEADELFHKRLKRLQCKKGQYRKKKKSTSRRKRGKFKTKSQYRIKKNNLPLPSKESRNNQLIWLVPWLIPPWLSSGKELGGLQLVLNVQGFVEEVKFRRHQDELLRQLKYETCSFEQSRQ